MRLQDIPLRPPDVRPIELLLEDLLVKPPTLASYNWAVCLLGMMLKWPRAVEHLHSLVGRHKPSSRFCCEFHDLLVTLIEFSVKCVVHEDDMPQGEMHEVMSKTGRMHAQSGVAICVFSFFTNLFHRILVFILAQHISYYYVCEGGLDM